MRFFVVLFLLFSSLPVSAEVYLLSRNKLEGTDLTQVVFLQHPQMTTLASCDAERKAARTTGFKLFARLYFSTRKGLSVQDQFYCVESDHQITQFRPGLYSEFTYLVSLKNNSMTLKTFPSLGACTTAAGPDNQSSRDKFCAKSGQNILLRASN